MGLLKRGGLRQIDTRVFVAGQRQTIDVQVPKRFMQNLYLTVEGRLDISNVVVPGVVHNDGAANLITDVELLVDGKTLKKGSGASFLRAAQIFYGTYGANDGIVGAGAGQYPFRVVIPLKFETPHSLSPIDSLLDGRAVHTMTLNITWGTTASLVYGNTSTLAFGVTPTVELEMEDTEPFPTKGPFWMNREVETVVLAANPLATAAQTRLIIPFQPGAIMRGIQLRAVDGGALGVNDLSDTIINRTTLRINGEEAPFNLVPTGLLKNWPNYEFGGNGIRALGYLHVELSENGKPLMTGLGAKVSGAAVNTVDIIADISASVGNGQVIAHTMELVPPGAL